VIEREQHICGAWADKQVRQIAVIKLANRAPHLSIEPDSVVSMKVRPASPGWHPRIEMRRVPVTASSTGGAAEAWDRAGP
jgi:hypothetical protein